MISEIVAPVRRVVRALLASHSPPELAAGFTLGMIIGLVPKGNLIALSLCVLLFSMRVNKGLGLAAAALFSCIATCIDPFAHKLGLIVLSAEPLQISYACVYNMPLGPWLEFHNTVMTGALVVGLYIAYPVYSVTQVLIERIAPHSTAWLSRTRVAQWLADGEADFQPRAAA